MNNKDTTKNLELGPSALDRDASFPLLEALDKLVD